MRRLSLQLLALAVTLAGLQLVAHTEPFAPFLLRDGLLVAAGAGLLFAWNAPHWRATVALQRLATALRLGLTLLLTGLVCASAGGLVVGLGLTGVLGLAAQIAWLLGLALTVAGAWWPGGEREYARPAFRWGKDGTGHFVRLPAGEPATPPAPAPSRRALVAWTLALLAVAALLRLGNLDGLPPGCVDQECAEALRLVNGEPLSSSSPFQYNLLEHSARLLLPLTGETGVLALRLTATLFGLGAVAAALGAARRLAAPPQALLATLVAVFSPWLLWAGRTSQPAAETAFLVALALWLTLEAVARGDSRWWPLAGLALGVLWVETPPLRMAILLWLAVVAALGLALPPPGFSRRRAPAAVATGLGAALIVALPALAASWRAGALFARPAAADPLANLVALGTALLRPDATVAAPFAASGLVSLVAVALALAGAAALLRHLRQPAAGVVWGGALLVLIGLIGTDQTDQTAIAPGAAAATAPAALLLALLPFLFAFAAVSVDQTVAALLDAWGRTVRPRRLLAGAAIVLALILIFPALSFLADLEGAQGGAQAVEAGIARHIAAELAADPAGQTTYVVPAALLDDPSLRLLAGAALSAGRVLPLDIAQTLPMRGAPAGDVAYLLPTDQAQTVDLLRRLYPTVTVQRMGGDPGGSGDSAAATDAQFVLVQVPHETLAAAHGLQTVTFAGRDFGSADEAAASAVAPAPAFDWRATPPLAGPFSVQAYASLLVPEAGDYTFALESDEPTASATLQLDNVLLLDTALGVNEQTVPLAQGIYRLDLAYRSGEQPGALRLLWQPPRGERVPLPAEALFLPVVANTGLQGDYYAGYGTDGTLLTRRKDLVAGVTPGLATPYTVHWQGKLAAPRAGDYLLSVLAGGPVRLSVDDQTVIELQPGEDAQTPGYAEGLIYLTTGWHPLDIVYTAEGDEPPFRLLWQPPGSPAGEVTASYLNPAPEELAPGDLTLPPAPPLLDVALDGDDFALARAGDYWQPQRRVPPRALAPLPLEALWSYGAGCGSGTSQLNAPRGLSFDATTGRLFVADTGNRRVKVLTLDGGAGEAITSDLFQEPVDVAVGPDGLLYVLDAGAQAVFRVGADGAVEAVPLQTTFYRPRGLDVDPAGNVVVADTGGGRVAVVSPTGELFSQNGGQGTALAKGQPVDVAADTGVIWTVTAEDGRLWNLPVDGSVTAVAPMNTIDGPKLAGLPNGSLLVSDPARGSFVVVAGTGQPVQQFAYQGQLSVPTGIAAAGLGDATFIAVADTAACSVSLWRVPTSQLR